MKRPGKKVYSGVYPYLFEKIVGRKGMFERDQNQTNSSFFPMKFKDLQRQRRLNSRRKGGEEEAQERM